MNLSIVICAHNAEHRIRDTLSHLQGQEPVRGFAWELVVVNNASHDRTVEVAREQWALKPVVSMVVVNCDRPGLLFARLCGVRTARADWICFIDDDNWVCSDWVSKVIDACRRFPEAAIIGACARAICEGAEPQWYAAFSRYYAVGSQADVTGYLPVGSTVYGAGMTVQRRAWESVYNGEFSPVLHGRVGKKLYSGEDTEFCLASQILGWRLAYEPTLTLSHFMPSTRLGWSYLMNMAKAMGASYVRLVPYFNTESLSRRKSIFARSLYGSWSAQLCYRGIILAFRSFVALGKRAREGSPSMFLYYHSLGGFCEIIANRNNFKKWTEAAEKLSRARRSSSEVRTLACP